MHSQALTALDFAIVFSDVGKKVRESGRSLDRGPVITVEMVRISAQ